MGPSPACCNIGVDYEVGCRPRSSCATQTPSFRCHRRFPLRPTTRGRVGAGTVHSQRLAFGLANYFTPDTSTSSTRKRPGRLQWNGRGLLSAQLTDEREAGGLADLGGQLLSRNIGLRVTTASEHAVFNFAGRLRIRRAASSAWGSNPTWPNPVLKNSNRAGEEAALSASPTIRRTGVPGLSGSIIPAAGWNARPGTGSCCPRSPSSI